MPEWSNGTVSKTVVRATVPRVRIPLFPPPPAEAMRRWASLFLFDLFQLRRATADAVRYIRIKTPFKNVFSLLGFKTIWLRLSICIMYIFSNVVTTLLIPGLQKILKKYLNDISAAVSLQLNIDCHLN